MPSNFYKILKLRYSEASLDHCSMLIAPVAVTWVRRLHIIISISFPCLTYIFSQLQRDVVVMFVCLLSISSSTKSVYEKFIFFQTITRHITPLEQWFLCWLAPFSCWSLQSITVKYKNTSVQCFKKLSIRTFIASLIQCIGLIIKFECP